MSETAQTPSGPTQLTAFSDWVKRVVDHLIDDRKWSAREVARRSGVARSIMYRWIDGKMTKAPDKETVEKFCDNLGLPRDEPFAIFGWATEGPTTPAPVPLPKVENPRLLAIQEILDRRGITDEEVFMVEAVLKRLQEQYSKSSATDEDEEAAG